MPLTNRLYQISGKASAGVLLLLLLGLPIVETWRMIVLLVGILALIHSDVCLEKRRILWGVGVIIPILIIKSILPAAGIEEGHNIFLYLREGEALQRGLPAPIFNEWRKEFDRLYPPATPPYEIFSWRYNAESGGLPDHVYTYSSDSLWRPAPYSRKVNTISFRNLAEFRGGFANELKYGGSWFRGLPDRRKMPFFVMYEFSKSSVGCTLHWPGAMFWERNDGTFEKIVHSRPEGKVISPSDSGKKVYILFLPDVIPEFPVHLELNGRLAISRLAGNVLTILGVFALLSLGIRIRRRPFLTASAIVAIALIFIYLSIAVSGGKPLGALYTPHGGGDDGVSHESWGRDMTRMVFKGEFREALRGFEDVYYATPGMRYARAVEKVFFSDTNLGLTAFLACLPWFLYLILYRLCGLRWALVGTGLFLFSPVSFSFTQYIFWGMLGYAEPLASGLFFVGLFLFLKSQPHWGGEANVWSAFIGGACLAGAVFLRPNLAIAGALLEIFFLYAGWRNRDFKIMVSALAGLGLALCMPLHNYYYGHEFYLISKSGATVSVLLTPLTYLKAIREILTGHWQGTQLTQAIDQIKGWLWTPPVSQFPLKTGIEVLLILRLMTLFVTVWALFVPVRKAPHLALLAWIALAAHLPMFFVFETKLRYDILGWDLSAIVTIMLVLYLFRNRQGSNAFQDYSIMEKFTTSKE